MTFTHLQIRSGYSFYQSTIQMDQLMEQASQDGHEALALTDEAVLHGAVAFYQACRRYNIHPVLGMALEVDVDGMPYQLIVLAKTNTGYRQLMQLSTMVQTKGNCQLDDLAGHSEEII